MGAGDTAAAASLKMDTEVGDGRRYGIRRQALVQNNPVVPLQ